LTSFQIFELFIDILFMLMAFSLACICGANIIFFSRRLLRYLFHFRERGYRSRSFLNWLVDNGVYDRKGTLIAIVAAIGTELADLEAVDLAISLAASIAMIAIVFWQNDLRAGLAETYRSISLYNRSMVLHSICFTLACVCLSIFNAKIHVSLYWLLVVGSIQSSPFLLVWVRNMQRFS
jgi:hypothetical protein